ncbi:MAG: hypothetical protein M3388_00455 [Acidobacteriota bacterium]|nr:hypothetical protein [Acidobacteriota bacterium]
MQNGSLKPEGKTHSKSGLSQKTKTKKGEYNVTSIINLKSFTCRRDTSEHDSDEPYVVVFAAKLKSPFPGVNIPTAHTVLYGRWGDIDSGDRGRTGLLHYGPGGSPLVSPENFWGLDGKPSELTNDNDVIFLVGLMENDYGNPGGVRAGLHAQLFAALTSYANAGMSRQDMVRKLLADMRDALGGVIATGIFNQG